MRIRTIVADDERLARRWILRQLAKDASIEVVGEYGDGRDALAGIRKTEPQLAFLDIRMPELDGFEVLERLSPSERPDVVFVTAFDAYAVKAFEIHAIDYLLKPFGEDRLAETLERVKRRFARPAVGRMLRWLLVRDGDVRRFVGVAEIDWIEANRNRVLLHGGSHVFAYPSTLREMEQALDPVNFLRLSRSVLVRLGSIRELQPWFHGDHIVVLRDGTKLTLSRTFASVLDRFRVPTGSS